MGGCPYPIVGDAGWWPGQTGGSSERKVAAVGSTPRTKHITHWISGRRWSGTAQRRGDVYDPATGEVTGQVDFAGIAEVDQAVSAAVEAFRPWRRASVARRTAVLFAFRELLNARR